MSNLPLIRHLLPSLTLEELRTLERVVKERADDIELHEQPEVREINQVNPYHCDAEDASEFASNRDLIVEKMRSHRFKTWKFIAETFTNKNDWISSNTAGFEKCEEAKEKISDYAGDFLNDGSRSTSDLCMFLDGVFKSVVAIDMFMPWELSIAFQEQFDLTYTDSEFWLTDVEFECKQKTIAAVKSILQVSFEEERVKEELLKFEDSFNLEFTQTSNAIPTTKYLREVYVKELGRDQSHIDFVELEQIWANEIYKSYTMN